MRSDSRLLRRLLAHPNPHTPRGQRSRAVVELLYGTGLRVGERERLDLADVHPVQEVLFTRSGKGGRIAPARRSCGRRHGTGLPIGVLPMLS